MTGMQMLLVVIGPIALAVALGLGFWLQNRDDAESRAQAAAQDRANDPPNIDPELGDALGYVKPDASPPTQAKG